MTLALEPRAMSRAETAVRLSPAALAAVFGALVGGGVGFAYLGGTAARASEVRVQAERLQGAQAAGFTEEAIAAAAGGLDESALSIARRHDPYTVAGGAQRDRQAAFIAARLDHLRENGGTAAATGLRPAAGTSPAAEPFNLGGSLDASRDLDCLTQAVYYEARGEGRAGMQAVAQVVLNRARHSAFPRTVCGVVYQGAARRTGCQFSFTCNGAMRGRVQQGAWDRARGIASAALSGQVFAPVGNATHFHTTSVSPSWRGALVRVGQVGSHVFYRFGGRSGSGQAFNAEPRRSSGTEGRNDAQRPTAPTPALPLQDQGPTPYNAVIEAEAAPAVSTPVTPVAVVVGPVTTAASPTA